MRRLGWLVALMLAAGGPTAVSSAAHLVRPVSALVRVDVPIKQVEHPRPTPPPPLVVENIDLSARAAGDPPLRASVEYALFQRPPPASV